MAEPFAPPLRYGIPLAVGGLFCVLLGFFSTAPAYRQLGEQEAVLTLSFSHSGQLKFGCSHIDPAVLAKLQPNMRKKMDCPRERALVSVEIDMDQQALYRLATPPLGLQRDGPATVYRSLHIPAGHHRFSARLADGADGSMPYAKDAEVDLRPGQVMVIDFLTGSGGFVFSKG